MGSATTTFSITDEPAGDTYRRLLSALACLAAEIGFVVRPELGLSDEGQHVLAQLLPFAIFDTEANEWPGTRLLRGNARVIRLPATDEVVALLGKLTASLYSWQHPNLPEDIFFVRRDGTTLLGTIAHERDAFLELLQEEESALIRKMPELSHMIRLT